MSLSSMVLIPMSTTTGIEFHSGEMYEYDDNYHRIYLFVLTYGCNVAVYYSSRLSSWHLI